MAVPCACRSLCQNSPPIGNDELASTALTKGSGTPKPTPAILYAPTPTLAIAFAVPLLSDNKLFKQFMKAYLEVQLPGQIAAKIDLWPCKQPLKAWFPDFYYTNLHINCYQFCQ